MSAYEEGYAAGQRGEEAAPGCTATPYGREWLAGYVAGVRARSTLPAGAGNEHPFRKGGGKFPPRDDVTVRTS
jgi:hypothetical protein